jgi:hypothetical protein
MAGAMRQRIAGLGIGCCGTIERSWLFRYFHGRALIPMRFISIDDKIT